jgi:hypothetical protein
MGVRADCAVSWGCDRGRGKECVGEGVWLAFGRSEEGRVRYYMKGERALCIVPPSVIPFCTLFFFLFMYHTYSAW